MGFKMKSSLTKTQLYACYVLIRIPQLGRTWLYDGLVAFFFFFSFFSSSSSSSYSYSSLKDV